MLEQPGRAARLLLILASSWAFEEAARAASGGAATPRVSGSTSEMARHELRAAMLTGAPRFSLDDYRKEVVL